MVALILPILLGCSFRTSPTQGLQNTAAANELVNKDMAIGAECRITDTITCPKWLCANVLGLFFDVELFCKFPTEEMVFKRIEHDEQRILSFTSIAFLRPAAEHGPMNFWELQDAASEEDLNLKLTEIGGTDLQAAIGQLMREHEDTCAGNEKFPPAASVDEIFNNVKSLVDEFDIFTKCTQTYVKRRGSTGRPQLRKDDVVAIATELAHGMFSLSYDDVAQYEEYTSLENGKPIRTLKMVISSRKENVVEGNYDIQMRIEDDKVRVEYRKRQNLAEPKLQAGITHNGYAIVTQQSIDSTLRKLAYAGVYGRAALSDGGCYTEPNAEKWGCAEYGSLNKGDACKYGMQCKSGECKKESGCLFSCESFCE